MSLLADRILRQRRLLPDNYLDIIASCSTTAQSLIKACHVFSLFPPADDIPTGGIVLWSRSFTPEAAQLATSTASPVNSLIREALIEGRTADEKYEKDGYAVKWTFVNDLELIFVVRQTVVVVNAQYSHVPLAQVAYQRILQLTYVDDLLTALKALFVKCFEPFIAAFVASLHAMNTVKNNALQVTLWDFRKAFDGWDMAFDKLLRGFEEKAALVCLTESAFHNLLKETQRTESRG